MNLKEPIERIINKNDGYIYKDGDYQLRPFKDSPEDLALVKQLYSDKYVNAMAAPMTDAGYAVKLGKFIRSYEENGISCYVLEKKSLQSDGGTQLRNIGLAGFTYLDDEKTQVELNAALLPEYQSSKIATTLGPKILKFGFDELKLSHIYGESLTFNIPSQRVMRTLGMVPVDGLGSPTWITNNPDYYKDTDVCQFVISKEDWQANLGAKSWLVEFMDDKDLHPKSRSYGELIEADNNKIISGSVGEVERAKMLKRKEIYQELVNSGKIENGKTSRGQSI